MRLLTRLLRGFIKTGTLELIDAHGSRYLFGAAPGPRRRAVGRAGRGPYECRSSQSASSSPRRIRVETRSWRGLGNLIQVRKKIGRRGRDKSKGFTRARVREGKGVSPAFLFATLLWHEVLVTWKLAIERGEKPAPALFDACSIRPSSANTCGA